MYAIVKVMVAACSMRDAAYRGQRIHKHHQNEKFLKEERRI